MTLASRGTLVHGLSDPYEAVEMHVGSGIAIVSSVEPDLGTGAANYVLSVIELDPATATLVDMDPRIAPHVDITGVTEYRRYSNTVTSPGAATNTTGGAGATAATTGAANPATAPRPIAPSLRGGSRGSAR